MKIIEKQTSELVAYNNNPRKNESAVKPVADSISQFGFKQPIVIDGNNIIIAGHTRLQAAKQLGLPTVPCVVADDLTEAEAAAYRLVDNVTAEYADWNVPELQAELMKFPDILADWKFPVLNLEELDRITSEKVGAAIEKQDRIIQDTIQDTINGRNFLSKHAVVVDCADESEQRSVFALLQKSGYNPRVVSI